MRHRKSNIDESQNELIEKVIKINRVNKVVKGGKRLAFRAMVIVGDQEGQVNFGLGKAKEVPVAIKKAFDKAKKNMYSVELVNYTLPHDVVGEFGASKVLIKSAPDGTGVIAGGPVRILLEALGVKNAVAKSLGAKNPVNIVRAALDGLMQCRNLKNEEKLRGKKLPVYFKRSPEVKGE